jgi:NAD(P)-dependent dehydrogenase (short-subunit alcohol dehydrogenase family)
MLMLADTDTNMTQDVFENQDIKERLGSMHAMGLGKPEYIAKAAVFLASDDAQWVTGVGLPVDGGYNSK